MTDSLEAQSTRAALYALGLLDPEGEAAFSLQLGSETNVLPAFRDLAELQSDLLQYEAITINRQPPARVKARILERIASVPQHRFPEVVQQALNEAGFSDPKPGEAIVFADTEAKLRWANPAFTDLCGYTLAELRGQKPGTVLQGAKSEPAAVEALRAAITYRRPHIQKMTNYHRNGSIYSVEIDLRPVSSGFIAVERQLVTG